MPDKEVVLVSSCLVGLCTRYDGRIAADRSCIQHLEDKIWIPVCPEQLGGLPTPRDAADIKDGNGEKVLKGSARVICKNGPDVTAAFIKGADQVLEIAQKQNISTAFLKSRSPSCGVKKLGVTAALLKLHGIKLEEFDS